MKMINNKTMKMTIAEAKGFLKDMSQDCNSKGKKNVAKIQAKLQDKKDGYVCVINENTKIMGYLIWLQTLVKKFKTCDILVASGNMSWFYCK